MVKEKFIKIFVSILAAILIIVLIVIKYNRPEFKIGWVFLFIFLIILLTSAIFAFFKYRDVIKERREEKLVEKLPPAITIEQAREIAKTCLLNPDYAEYTDNCYGEKIMKLGEGQKTWIYLRKSKGEFDGNFIYILLNMHRTEKRDIIITERDLGDRWWINEDILKAANELAEIPTPTPSIRETYLRSPLTGIEQIVKEKIQEIKEKSEKDEEEKKELK